MLVLREALGFSAQEVADLLETTVASVNSALQRARASVDDRLPGRDQQATLKAIGDEKLRAIVDDYVAAWERGDVEAVVAMLAEEATMAMPPMALWFRGRDACEVFLREWAFGQRWAGERFEEGERDVRLVVTTASGQPAIGAYRRDGDAFRPYALQVLTFAPTGGSPTSPRSSRRTSSRRTACLRHFRAGHERSPSHCTDRHRRRRGARRGRHRRRGRVGGDDDATEKPITGAALERASQAALDQVGGGEVTGTEAGDEEGAYEVEVTREGGGQVDVHLDEDFRVLGAEGEGDESEDDDGS